MCWIVDMSEYVHWIQYSTLIIIYEILYYRKREFFSKLTTYLNGRQIKKFCVHMKSYMTILSYNHKFHSSFIIQV